MLKIYLNKSKENWILDRLIFDWYSDNSSISTNNIFLSNIIWICVPWTWKKISKRLLSKKKVVCSIYHIDEEKFTPEDVEEFKLRDNYVDLYHVISENTKKQVQKYTDKKIVSIPFWADSNIWFPIKDNNVLKEKFNLPKDRFVIGSFQRDTEGYDLKSPKLSKGPDRFIEIVKTINLEKNVHVLLTGKRRNYVINELNKNNINFSYFEMVDQDTLNLLYNCLDLYVVASRVEGGPQSIIECALSKTPIISTNVGVAQEILSSESIFDMKNYNLAKPNVNYAYKKVQSLIKPNGYQKFINMFKDINEN